MVKQVADGTGSRLTDQLVSEQCDDQHRYGEGEIAARSVIREGFREEASSYWSFDG